MSPKKPKKGQKAHESVVFKKFRIFQISECWEIPAETLEILARPKSGQKASLFWPQIPPPKKLKLDFLHKLTVSKKFRIFKIYECWEIQAKTLQNFGLAEKRTKSIAFLGPKFPSPPKIKT